MILMKDFLKGLFKITYQCAADTSGIHLADFNTGFLQETAVNTNFTKFILNQNDLLVRKDFL